MDYEPPIVRNSPSGKKDLLWFLMGWDKLGNPKSSSSGQLPQEAALKLTSCSHAQTHTSANSVQTESRPLSLHMSVLVGVSSETLVLLLWVLF